MAHVVLFHHVLGLTPGVVRLADELRSHGHQVTTPDLFDGQQFDDLASGLAYVEALGDREFMVRAERACVDLPADVVFAGLSLGVVAAQQLLQAHPSVHGGLFLHSFLPPSQIPGNWPSCPVHVFGMDADPFFVGDGDLEVAQQWQTDHDNLSIHLYPGDGHLYMEPESDDFDPRQAEATAEDIVTALATMDDPQ